MMLLVARKARMFPMSRSKEEIFTDRILGNKPTHHHDISSSPTAALIMMHNVKTISWRGYVCHFGCLSLIVSGWSLSKVSDSSLPTGKMLAPELRPRVICALKILYYRILTYNHPYKWKGDSNPNTSISSSIVWWKPFRNLVPTLIRSVLCLCDDATIHAWNSVLPINGTKPSTNYSIPQWCDLIISSPHGFIQSREIYISRGQMILPNTKIANWTLQSSR